MDRTPFFPIVMLALATACGDLGADARSDQGPPAESLHVPASIAYVTGDGRELRAIDADGTGDRLVWRVPTAPHTITAPAWRPDGSEIAFASDHEMAVSFFQRDLYAIRPDGTALRKLTNPPRHEELASLPKGTVTVSVENLTYDGGPYFVYVMGAPEPQQVTIGPAATERLQFAGVADLGNGISQPAVMIHGVQRWWDAAAAADVRSGATVDAGRVAISANPIAYFGADAPFWRADGERIGFFFGPTCLLQQVPANPPPGPSYEPLVDPEVFGPVCAADWGPNGELLLVDATSEYVESGRTSIYRVAPGSPRKSTPVAVFDEYVRVVDIRWLPDGSGFIVARQDALVDEDINLYEFTFETAALRKLTDLSNEFVRRFSIAPDGRSIAFERVRGDVADLATLPSDLWILEREDANPRLLVRNAAFPTWNPVGR